MILYLNSDSLPKKNNNSALLEVTILILPLPNQIILHMINRGIKFLLKSPYSSAKNIESRFLTYPAMKKLK